MLKKLIILVAVVLAGLGGLFAGEMLGGGSTAQHPASPQASSDDVPPGSEETHSDTGAGSNVSGGHHAEGGEETSATVPSSYFRFPSQFFVPVMHGERLEGVMVLTLTLEMPEEMEEYVYQQEFRLRDALLRTLMIHANTGGFDGNYTLEPRMRHLREALLSSAQDVAGEAVTNVLIEDLAQQASS